MDMINKLLNDRSKNIRKLAEDRFKINSSGYHEETSYDDMKRLNEELQIHQIELELQNEELINSQEQLKQVKNNYHDLYDNAPISYLTFDINGNIIQSNLTAKNTFNINKSALNNLSFYQYIPEENRDFFYLHLKDVIKGIGIKSCDLMLYGNKNRLFNAKLDTIKIDNNTESIFRTAITDITNLKNMENEIRENEKQKIELIKKLELQNNHLELMNKKLTIAYEDAEKACKAKDSFLGVMSHELRTPLNGILGLSQVMLIECKDEETKEAFENIYNSGNHLLSIITDLIDITIIESGNISEIKEEEICLKDILKSVKEIVANSVNEKKLKLRMPDNDFNFIVDKSKLRQILINLISNAIKFTNEGTIDVNVSITDNNVLFEISDTGIGIAEDKLKIIFETFYQIENFKQRRHGGVGLGLAICKKLVEKLGGDIWVDSIEGEGSNFYLQFLLKPVKKLMKKNNHSSFKYL